VGAEDGQQCKELIMARDAVRTDWENAPKDGSIINFRLESGTVGQAMWDTQKAARVMRYESGRMVSMDYAHGPNAKVIEWWLPA
jgi:hypothetical protein